MYQVSDEEMIDLDNKKDFEYLKFYVKKILVAQNIKELKYLIKNTKDQFRVLPLNLKTQLFCVSKNIKFINLSRILDNNIHKNIIIETEKILNKINTNIFFYNSLNKELKAWLRFRIYSFLFLYFVIPKIRKQDRTEQIVVSGWNILENLYSENNYFVSSFIKSILRNKVKVLKKKQKLKIQSFMIMSQYSTPKKVRMIMLL